MADAGILELQQGTEPATPSSGFGIVYVDQVDGHLKHKNDAGVVVDLDITGAGTVTSVALAAPPEFTVTGSPVTSSGTLTLNKADQNSNTVYAGPASGSPNPPTFRSLVSDDVPNLDFSKITTGTVPVARGGTNSTTALNNNRVMQSFAGAIVESNAITANRALTSDANGIPTHSAVTSAELGYVSGVTSSIQTQLNGKENTGTTVLKTGDTMSGTLTTPEVIISATNGTGFIEYPRQVSTPATPASGKGFHLYADNTGKFSWIGENGFTRTFDGTANTANRTYTLPDTSGSLILDPTTTTGDLIYKNSGGALTRLGIGATNQVLTVSSGLPAWIDPNINGFGDKSDGSVSITGVTNMTGPVYYDTLTISGAGQLVTNGYPVYCRTLDLSNAGAGAINWDGNAGNNSTGSAGGGAPGAGTDAYLGGGGNGTAGGSSTTTTGNQAGAPTAQNPGNGGRSNSSGAGGAGAAGGQAGGAARAGSNVSNSIKFGMMNANALMMRNSSLINGGTGGAGGGGGGGSGTQVGTGGGSGGGGGNCVVIFAQSIITTGSTASGAIRSRGGIGGSAGNAANSNAGAGGGGSGGGGGYVYLAYMNKTGASVTNLINASGGNGGNGGNGNGTGAGGNGGNGGDGGNLDIINALTRTGNHIAGGLGNAGTSASGATGGTGGSGGLAVFSL